MRQHLHRATWSYSMPVDVLCSAPTPAYAQALRVLLDQDSYPYSNLLNFTFAEFGSELAYRTEIVAVHHGEVNAPFLFGAKGVLISDPERFVIT